MSKSPETMSSRRSSLSIPDRTGTEDAGARELDSDSEDHFSDAQSVPAQSSRASPIPRTRVEKVSDEPSYGEVPGTQAYKLREGDALPDEIAFVPEDQKKSGEFAAPPSPGRPTTPGGRPIPTTVVEETEDGDGAKTPETKKHHSDPLPDLVVKADGTVEVETKNTAEAPISPASSTNSSPTQSRRRSSTNGAGQKPAAHNIDEEDKDEDEDEEEDKEEGGDDFGDDFDDFEEGGDGDDDFGDFDDGFQEPQEDSTTSTTDSTQPQPAATARSQQPSAPTLSFPIPDFSDLDTEEILKATSPYLNGIYRPEDDPALNQPPPQLSNSLFLTPRSASLWSQLVAPPPLQPPDWIRSRIRRLFLVSLGVPVDLDEILPASKQKKLVLPSLSVLSTRNSPRTSTDSRRSKDNGGTGAANNSVARLKQQGANASNSSVDSQGRTTKEGGSGSSRSKRKGPPPPPDLDLVSARQLATTTDEALDGMTNDELAAHLEELKSLEETAKEVLDYWTKRTDEKIGDREAFEGVIENLVKHARKTRK